MRLSNIIGMGSGFLMLGIAGVILLGSLFLLSDCGSGGDSAKQRGRIPGGLSVSFLFL